MTEFREAGDAQCEHSGCGAAGTACCCFCLRRMCPEHIARVSLFTLATCFVPWPPHLTDLLDDLAARHSHARLWLCEDCQLGGYRERDLESENSVDLSHTGVAATLPQNL